MIILHRNEHEKIWTSGSDVLKTFKKIKVDGKLWQPPGEYRNDYLFKINREKLEEE